MKQFVYISDVENVWLLGQVIQEEANQLSVAVGSEEDARTFQLPSTSVLPAEVIFLNEICFMNH